MTMLEIYNSFQEWRQWCDSARALGDESRKYIEDAYFKSAMFHPDKELPTIETMYYELLDYWFDCPDIIAELKERYKYFAISFGVRIAQDELLKKVHF